MKTQLIILLLFLTSKSFTQVNLENALVVRLNPSYLNLITIDNTNFNKGRLIDFCNPKGNYFIDSLDKQFNLQIGLIPTEKLFLNLKTSDKFSIGRQGQKVAIPPFWATFSFQFEDLKKMREYKFILDKCYPFIIYTHPFYQIEYESLPNDEYIDLQKGLINSVNPISDIDIEGAWQIETGRNFIKVGVFDSGIDAEHEDLNVLTGCTCFEYNPSQNVNFGIDKLGHGTSVAGIIGAKRNNGLGIAGIAGGENIDSLGVSLLDFKLTDSSGTFSRLGVGVGLIDASRRVNTYYDWEENNIIDDIPFQTTANPGFGIHIANHSYNMKVFPFTRPNDIGLGDSIFIEDLDNPLLSECQLCREAFLFSLKNGVINVVSRGNKTNFLSSAIGPAKVPSLYDDSWVISVGSSDITGDFIDSNELTMNGYNSYIGRSVDLLAPGTKSTVFTTKSSHSNTGIPYRYFNGTSAAAPHVTGVVALLLSKYNKPCYSNVNLDPADVEYILQKSAKDLKTLNYDDSTGWGLLNAKKALEMIDFPQFQIIHPDTTIINLELIDIDTIHVFVNYPIYHEYLGPLGQDFTLNVNSHYKAERYKLELTYDFSNYMLPTSQLIDLWVRFSQTNSVIITHDTSYAIGYIGNTGQLGPILNVDTFNIEPYANISLVDSINHTVKLTGYYYNFINKMDNQFLTEIETINFWYPLNPFLNQPKMTYSIYIFDTTLISRYDFPCDSLNTLLDPTLNEDVISLNEINIYPNPSNGILQIEGLDNNFIGDLELTNLDGRLIQNIQLSKIKNCNFNFEYLPSGIYIIQYRTNNLQISKKWVKI